MANHDGRIRFGYILDAFGNHTAAWLRPNERHVRATSFRHFASMAQALEAAKFDLMFVADFPSIPDGSVDQISRSQYGVNVLEPTTLLSAISAVTQHIGLIGTVSTSYCEPYNVARMFASLDHISGGRAAWNAVTTRNRAASYNFGHDDLDDHDTRYARAREFIEIVKGLWDSYEEGAFALDRTSGRYFDPGKLHTLGHKGPFFSVRGPLNIERPPQGHPLITQAGGSEEGKELAAETADLVFSLIGSLEGAKAFYQDLKARLPKFGRTPEDLKVMSGITVVVGTSRDEAEEKSALVSAGIHKDVARAFISGVLDIPLDHVPLDSPIPAHEVPATSNKGQTYFAAVRRWAVDEALTLRQLGARFAEARIGSIVKGTPADVADQLESWVQAGATDGYMLKANTHPDGLLDICTLVMPELQRRGLARTEYDSSTLRGHFGLDRPSNRFAPRAGSLRHAKELSGIET